MTEWARNTFGEMSAKIVLGVLSGAGVALLAYLLLGLPAGPPNSFPYQDKVYHFLAFACVTGPAILAISRRYWFFWLAHMLVLAAGTEIAQGMAGGGRSASVGDFLADALGIAVATATGDLIRRGLLKR